MLFMVWLYNDNYKVRMNIYNREDSIWKISSKGFVSKINMSQQSSAPCNIQFISRKDLNLTLKVLDE